MMGSTRESGCTVGLVRPKSRLGKFVHLTRCALVALFLVASASTLGSQSTPLPPLSVLQLDVRQAHPELDGPRVSVGFSEPTPINDILLMLVRNTRLSVIPDPSLEQTFLGDVKTSRFAKHSI
jgi:hypothetical protein